MIGALLRLCKSADSPACREVRGAAREGGGEEEGEEGQAEGELRDRFQGFHKPAESVFV